MSPGQDCPRILASPDIYLRESHVSGRQENARLQTATNIPQQKQCECNCQEINTGTFQRRESSICVDHDDERKSTFDGVVVDAAGAVETPGDFLGAERPRRQWWSTTADHRQRLQLLTVVQLRVGRRLPVSRLLLMTLGITRNLTA